MKAQFKKYTLTPNDKYGMIGFAEVLLDLEGGGRAGLRYKHLPTKDMKGTFFCPCTISVEEGGEKKYHPDHFMDSRSDDDELQELLRDGVNRWTQQRSAQPAQSSSPMQYPHGMCQPQQPAPQRVEVAEEQPLPF